MMCVFSYHFSVLVKNLCCVFSVLQLAKKYHPDVNRNDPEAQKKFQTVSEAYEVLMFDPLSINTGTILISSIATSLFFYFCFLV